MGDNIFVTGPPRSGKSTLIGEVIEEKDLNAEGIRTPDIREAGQRKGFKLLDIASGEEGILAHVDRDTGPRVGKYRVNIGDLDKFTKKSLKDISSGCDVVVIDEIGTMELYLDEFESAVHSLLESEIPVLSVLHRNYISNYEKFGTVYDLGEREYRDTKEKVIQNFNRVLD